MALHPHVLVKKNDEITIAQIKALAPTCIIISPGPKRPEDAGIIIDMIAHFAGKVPILGICLGHQALGCFLGAKLIHAPYPMHGKISKLIWDNAAIHFAKQFPEDLKVMRYHSLVLDAPRDLKDFQPLAYAQDDGTLMMFCSPKYAFFGIQFHPESIGTPFGKDLLGAWYNWLKQLK